MPCLPLFLGYRGGSRLQPCFSWFVHLYSHVLLLVVHVSGLVSGLRVGVTLHLVRLSIPGKLFSDGSIAPPGTRPPLYDCRCGRLEDMQRWSSAGQAVGGLRHVVTEG